MSSFKVPYKLFENPAYDLYCIRCRHKNIKLWRLRHGDDDNLEADQPLWCKKCLEESLIQVIRLDELRYGCISSSSYAYFYVPAILDGFRFKPYKFHSADDLNSWYNLPSYSLDKKLTKEEEEELIRKLKEATRKKEILDKMSIRLKSIELE